MSDSGQSDSDSLEIEIRPVERIVRRLLVLQTIADRVALEGVSTDHPDSEDDSDALRFDQIAPLFISGAIEECSAKERVFLTNLAQSTTLGNEPVFALAGEALEVLLTVCGIGRPLPPPPQRYLPVGLDRSRFESSRLDAQLAKTLHGPDPGEAAEARERVELWHWRALTEFEIRTANPAERAKLRKIVRTVTAEAVHSGLVAPESRDDFGGATIPVSSWSDDELMAFAIAVETRLKALNWLCGFGATWDDVPLDV